MKVAIPTWNERVSPVFESAGTFVFLEVENGCQKARDQAQLAESLPPVKVRWLVDHEIDVLICGAISRPVSDLALAVGVSLIPWVCGEIDQVIAAFLANALPQPDLTMPGCCGRRMRAHRGGRGRGARDGRRDRSGRGPRNSMRRKP